MALDFPASPSVGQVFTSGNQSWLWDGAKWTALGSVQNVYKPNKLINPFRQIDQRNEGAAINLNNSIGYVTDGLVAQTSNLGTAQRVTAAPPGYSNSVLFTNGASWTPTATQFIQIYTPVEASDLEDTRFGTAAAQSLAYAIWLQGSVATVIGLTLFNGAGNRSYTIPITITAANTWQLFSGVIPGDVAGTWDLSSNGPGLYMTVCIAAGSSVITSTLNQWQAGLFRAPNTITNGYSTTLNATFNVGPAGLWVSPSPQPLLRTSIMAELARCQRYVEKSYDLGTALGAVNVTSGQSTSGLGGAASATYSAINTVAFAVNKRTAPTITMYSPVTGASGHIRDYNSNADITATLATGVGTHSFPWLGTNSAASGGFNLGVHFFADASL